MATSENLELARLQFKHHGARDRITFPIYFHRPLLTSRYRRLATSVELNICLHYSHDADIIALAARGQLAASPVMPRARRVALVACVLLASLWVSGWGTVWVWELLVGARARGGSGGPDVGACRVFGAPGGRLHSGSDLKS